MSEVTDQLRPDPSSISFPALDAAAQAYVQEQLVRYWQADENRMARVSDFGERLRGARADSDVLFLAVHGENFPTVEYLVHGLRARGIKTYGVYWFSELTGKEPFDVCMSCGGSLGALVEVLLRIPKLKIYLQAHAKRSWLSQLVRALRPDVKIYHEIYDWMDAFVAREHEQAFIDENVFSRVEIDLMRACETWVRTRSNGFVYKDGGAPMAELLAKSTAPSVQVMPCPPKSYQRAPRTPAAGPLKLVHAGQLRSAGSSRAFTDLYAIPLYEELMRQDCEVTVYPSAVANMQVFEQFFGDYFRLGQREHAFRFAQHLPLKSLIEALNGQQHYGMLLYHFDEDLIVGKRHLRGALASKLFMYWAAGLPVLVSEELAYMASLVADTGAGVVVTRNELGTLAQRLASLDYAELQRRVVLAQQRFHIERFIPRLVELLETETAASPAAACA